VNNFTEGDWLILDQRELPGHVYDYAIVDEAGWYIANIENCSNKEDEANAILIAKAPKMHRLLERILKFQKENYGDGVSTHVGLSILANDIERLLKEENLWVNVNGVMVEDGIASKVVDTSTAPTAMVEDGYQSVTTVERNSQENTAISATQIADAADQPTT
jgi:hypothetical protein